MKNTLVARLWLGLGLKKRKTFVFGRALVRIWPEIEKTYFW